MACTLQGGAVLHHVSRKSGLPGMQLCAELNAGASTLGEGDDVERHTLVHSGVTLQSSGTATRYLLVFCQSAEAQLSART